MGSKNHRRLLSLGLLLALAPFSASAREVWIYVTDSGGDRVEVIDPTTNKVVQVIGGIAAPHGVGFSPDGSQIYISNKSKNALDIVDRASGQITDEVGLSGRPNNIAVTKDGGRVLVAIRGGKGGLDVIDAANSQARRKHSSRGAAPQRLRNPRRQIRRRRLHRRPHGHGVRFGH